MSDELLRGSSTWVSPPPSGERAQRSREISFRILQPSRLLPRRPSKRPFNRRLLAVLLGLALIVVVVRLTSRLRADNHIPAELVGKWETDNHRYAGRALIFHSDAMVFQAGPRQAATSNRIRGVKQRRRAGVTDYIIVGYSDEEGESTLTLKYRPSEQIIELVNLDGILWRRVR